MSLSSSVRHAVMSVTAKWHDSCEAGLLLRTTVESLWGRQPNAPYAFMQLAARHTLNSSSESEDTHTISASCHSDEGSSAAAHGAPPQHFASEALHASLPCLQQCTHPCAAKSPSSWAHLSPVHSCMPGSSVQQAGSPTSLDFSACPASSSSAAGPGCAPSRRLPAAWWGLQDSHHRPPQP